HIGSLLQRFAAELPTEGETNAATRQLKERGGVDAGISRPQFREVFVFGMHPDKINRSVIRRDRNAKVAKRIEWCGRPDKLRRGRVKDRIGCVQDTIKPRSGYLLPGLDVLELAVAPAGVVAPASIEQFVSFDAESCKNGISLIVE